MFRIPQGRLEIYSPRKRLFFMRRAKGSTSFQPGATPLEISIRCSGDGVPGTVYAIPQVFRGQYMQFRKF